MTETNKGEGLASLEHKISLLKKTRDLEQGRNEVLRMVAQEESLELVLNTLCHNAQIYNEDMFCSVLRFDAEHSTLHPIASASLPKYYCDALDGVRIGMGIGSCGTAAYTKKRVIVEDINTHPHWMQFKKLPLGAGLQACWSEPIIGKAGQLFGTFAMYYAIPTTPTVEDIECIESCANLAAVVFENSQTRKKLLDANYLLSQTIDQRNKELEQANIELSNMLSNQHDLHQYKINLEKVTTTKSLIIGFAHEINTPVGIALTAISTAESQFKELIKLLNQGKISRSAVDKKSDEIIQAITLNQDNLDKASQLLTKFNDINFELDETVSSSFFTEDFFNKLERNFNNRFVGNQLEVSSDNFEISHSENALRLVFEQLFDNSFTHGFKDKISGIISINVTTDKRGLVIIYQDNGCGISSVCAEKVFEPFYSSNRNKGSLGLGLNHIANIITSNFQGKIQLLPSPVGVRFEIKLPINAAK